MAINKQIANAIKKSLLKFYFSKITEKCTNEAQTRLYLIEPIIEVLGFSRIDDMPIQMYSWPAFKQDVLSCTNCQNRQFVEIPGGHTAIFQSQTAKTEFNNFINSR